MAAGREIHTSDLPPELKKEQEEQATTASENNNWAQSLRLWAEQALNNGQPEILTEAIPTFERAMIETALKHTGGRKRDAALLLGWGRNTLTRKMQELGMNGNRAQLLAEIDG